MKPIAYMTGASMVSWVCVAVIVDRRTSLEVLFGMLGPLTVASGTWFLVAWVYKERPEELTGLLAGAFLLKMVFFGAYLAAMLRIMNFRPIPFVVSFTGYFVGLYFMEALFMKRLFSGAWENRPKANPGGREAVHRNGLVGRHDANKRSK